MTSACVVEDVAGMTPREIRMRILILQTAHPHTEYWLDLDRQTIMGRPSA